MSDKFFKRSSAGNCKFHPWLHAWGKDREHSSHELCILIRRHLDGVVYLSVVLEVLSLTCCGKCAIINEINTVWPFLYKGSRRYLGCREDKSGLCVGGS